MTQIASTSTFISVSSTIDLCIHSNIPIGFQTTTEFQTAIPGSS